jgi:hypothetical protein
MRLCSAFLVSVLIFVYSVSSAAVIDVPDDQPTIQAGIDAADAGDTVLVADGVYSGEGNRDIDFRGKNMVVRSANGPESVWIECDGSESSPHRGFYFHSGEDSSAVLEGLTIHGGYGPYDFGGESVGGGIKCDSSSSPTFVNCTFSENQYGKHGGGIFCENSSPMLINCTFIGNRSTQTMLDYGHGSGIYCTNSELTLIGCAFIGNVSGLYGDGGGIYCHASSPSLDGCTFSGNSAGGIGGKGGGMFCYLSFPRLVDCHFGGNYAEYGGGMHCWGDSAILSNCTFSKNKATYDTQDGGWGGGLNCWGCSMSLINCNFSANDANPVSGWFGFGSAIAASGSSVSLEDCIIAFSPESDAIHCLESSFLLSCTDVFGNVAGDWVGCIADQAGVNGNFSLDPEFCDTTMDDYRLSRYSPCLPENNECASLIGAHGIGCGYICGNADDSDGVDIDDIVYIVAYVFSGGPEPAPYESGDADCSGTVDIDDVVHLIGYVFSGGAAPCDTNGDGEPDC